MEKNSPSKLSNRDFSTDSGTSVKLPDVEALLGERGANSSKPVDLQVGVTFGLLRHDIKLCLLLGDVI